MATFKFQFLFLRKRPVACPEIQKRFWAAWGRRWQSSRFLRKRLTLLSSWIPRKTSKIIWGRIFNSCPVKDDCLFSVEKYQQQEGIISSIFIRSISAHLLTPANSLFWNVILLNNAAFCFSQNFNNCGSWCQSHHDEIALGIDPPPRHSYIRGCLLENVQIWFLVDCLFNFSKKSL